jgi:glycerol-3-phosphate acyltransferase PlsY
LDGDRVATLGPSFRQIGWTAAGVFLALAPVQTLLVLLVFSVVLWSSGYVSLGSLTSATLLPVLLLLTVGVRSPLFVISVFLLFQSIPVLVMVPVLVLVFAAQLELRRAVSGGPTRS